jgi:autotransporter-associated beta strand protein
VNFFVRVAIILAMLCALGLTPVLASPPAGYYYVWGDEFNEPTLNTNNWDYWVLGKFDSEIDVTNAVSMNGSNLVITTYSVNGTNYSALIASDNHFHPRYGYYEASMQWGDTNGMCSCFWLRSPDMGSWVNDPYVAGGEIDVAEHVYVGATDNYRANTIEENMHWDGYGAYEQNGGSDIIGSNFLGQSYHINQGFHLYGFNWNKNGTYAFYVDGTNEFNGYPAPLFGRDAYMIFSAEVNNPPPQYDGTVPPGGYPPLATSPNKLFVDYCHYYAPTNILFWTGASSTSWSDSGNWVSNMVPGPGCDLTFSYLSANLNTMIAAPYSVDGLIFLDSTNPANISGTSTVSLGTGGIDMVSASQNVTLSMPIQIASNQTWTVGIQNPGNLLTVNSSLSGAATLTKAGYGTLVLNGANSFSGNFEIDTAQGNTNDGAVCVANSAAVASVASPIRIRDTGNSVSMLQLSNSANGVSISQVISVEGRTTNFAAIESIAGPNALNGGISLVGGGSEYLVQADSGTLALAGTITPASTVNTSCTLTLQGSGNIAVSGLQDGSSASLALTVAGPGTVTLSNTAIYTGATTVSRGTLAGVGSIAGSANIQGGTLIVGTAAPGTFSIGGSLNLAVGGTTCLRINRAQSENDQVSVTGSLSYGGTLVVTNLGGTFALGDSFQLFNAGTYSGNFSAIILPPLSGMGWITNQLASGIISVGPTAPQVLLDLPSQVTLASGQSYTYSISINATPPFGYQWYGNGIPVIGQTNATYTLIAQDPGTYTYDVAITNDYGSATSAVSTLTVIPQPPTAYAAAIGALAPVGYWPLQETNAQAPVCVETNLGTLGSIANAYYPNTNSPDITLGVPGAIVSDGDTAAGFNAAGQPYAFVPRSSSALTLVPPFTLEAWFYPSNTTYGVILGEGGGASLNGGPTYGGFQFGWAGSSQPSFQLQLYHYGINAYTALNTPATYSVSAWYHYVATFDTGSNATIYVNGVAIVSNKLTYAADTWSPLTIGNGKWSGLSAARGVSGTIDELAVYTNVLTASDIAAHYAAGINQTPSIPYKQVVLNDHPLLYYRMDNPSYTAPDIAASPLAVNYGSVPVEGTYLPGTVPAGVPGPAVAGWGPTSVASPINGIFSCIDAGYDPTFNPTNGQPFTVLLWFKGNPADSSMQALMGHGIGSWSLNLNGATGELIWNSGAGSVTSLNVYNDGAWHQAAGVYNGSDNYLYVDGALAGSGVASGTIIGDTNDVYLGGDPGYTNVGVNERYFAGAIAQAAIFTNALTLAQIQTTYQAAVSPSLPTLSIGNLDGSQIELSWSYGTLQSATNAAGPYQDLPNATSPSTIPATNVQQFYRVRED